MGGGSGRRSWCPTDWSFWPIPKVFGRKVDYNLPQTRVNFGNCAMPLVIFVQVLVKKLRKLFRFFCFFFVLWANLSIFLARMMLKSPTVAMISLLLPLATVFRNGGVFRFLTLSHI